MLSIKLTTCRECALISKLIDAINCQLAKMANNLYLNISYMLDKPVDACIMSTLLHYKRILMYKSCNVDWASDYSVDDIASRVNFLTVGCKCCEQSSFKIPTTTTTTTNEITTTTTTTEAPLQLCYTYNVVNTGDGSLRVEYIMCEGGMEAINLNPGQAVDICAVENSLSFIGGSYLVQGGFTECGTTTTTTTII